MSEPINLIIRESDDGSVYATSPQAPGLVFGRATLRELRADLQDVLAFHFSRPGPFEVLEHHERHYNIGDRELVTRLANDEHHDERQAVYERIGRALRMPGQAKSLTSAVTNKVGEAVYVCAVRSDTLSWLAAQLDGPSDAVMAALTTADEFLLTLPVTVGEAPDPGWLAAPVTPQTRLSEVIGRLPTVAPPAALHLEAV